MVIELWNGDYQITPVSNLPNLNDYQLTLARE